MIEDIHLRLKFSIGGIHELPADDNRLVLHEPRYFEIHGHIGEGSLESYPGRNVHVEDKFLQTLFDRFVIKPIIPDERSQQGIEIGKGLGASCLPLQGEKEVDYLSQDGAEMFSWPAGYLTPHSFESLQEQIVDIPAYAIYAQNTQVMDVYIPALLGFLHLGSVDLIKPILGYYDRGKMEVHPLQRISHIGVFLHPPVVAAQIIGYDLVIVGQ